jgi:hypothetical protein
MWYVKYLTILERAQLLLTYLATKKPCSKLDTLFGSPITAVTTEPGGATTSPAASHTLHNMSINSTQPLEN